MDNNRPAKRGKSCGRKTITFIAAAGAQPWTRQTRARKDTEDFGRTSAALAGSSVLLHFPPCLWNKV